MLPSLTHICQFLQMHYFDSAPEAVTPITKGEENLNFHIAMPGGTGDYVLRVYSLKHSTTGARQASDIDFELDFIDRVRELGIPTPRIMPTRQARRWSALDIEDQLRYAVVFEYIRGEEAAAYTPAIARCVANTLRELRKAAVGLPVRALRPWPGDLVELSLKYYKEHRQDGGRYSQTLDVLAGWAWEAYHALKTRNLPRGILHGDLKLGNLLFQADQLAAILDFDDYRESFLLEELARTLMHDLDSPTRNPIRAGQYEMFQEVFSADASISPAEMECLPAFLQARFVYDVTTYLENGHFRLVDDLFSDPTLDFIRTRMHFRSSWIPTDFG